MRADAGGRSIDELNALLAAAADDADDARRIGNCSTSVAPGLRGGEDVAGAVAPAESRHRVDVDSAGGPLRPGDGPLQPVLSARPVHRAPTAGEAVISTVTAYDRNVVVAPPPAGHRQGRQSLGPGSLSEILLRKPLARGDRAGPSPSGQGRHRRARPVLAGPQSPRREVPDGLCRSWKRKDLRT